MFIEIKPTSAKTFDLTTSIGLREVNYYGLSAKNLKKTIAELAETYAREIASGDPVTMGVPQGKTDPAGENESPSTLRERRNMTVLGALKIKSGSRRRFVWVADLLSDLEKNYGICKLDGGKSIASLGNRGLVIYSDASLSEVKPT